MGDNNKIIVFIKKNCYVVFPAFLIIVYIILDILNISEYLKIFNLENVNENAGTLIGISGTLIGFLFTSMTIFLSLNKDSKYMQNFKRYNHHIIFCRLILIGIFFLFLNIGCWLLNICTKIIALTFVLGFVETIMASYYTYKLSLNSFK